MRFRERLYPIGWRASFDKANKTCPAADAREGCLILPSNELQGSRAVSPGWRAGAGWCRRGNMPFRENPPAPVV